VDKDASYYIGIELTEQDSTKTQSGLLKINYVRMLCPTG